MKNQFVPYDLAVKLKELGFDEDLFYKYYYKGDIKSRIYDAQEIEYFDNKIIAPLWQQVFDWIRERYNITFWIQPCRLWFKKAYLWEYMIKTHDNHLIGHRSEYHEEQEALLRRLIRIIEEGEYDKE